MRRDVGASAGLLALLAVILHTQFGSLSEAPSAPAERTGIVSKNNEAGKKGAGGQPAQPVEGPWLATQAYFHLPRSLDRPQSPYNQDATVKALLTANGDPDSRQLKALLGVPETLDRYQMWSIVATVANPLHTRMALYLDGQIETIERSLQSAGWEFAEQWLPWSDRFEAAVNDIDERRQQRWLQEQEGELPGLLVFRSQSPAAKKVFPADRLLFVFLVPETATAGISGPPFYAAMHIASLLTNGANKVGLLAPTFSGSLSSLTGLIKEWRKGRHLSDRALAGTVYSGSVSNIGYAQAFKTSTGLGFHGGIVDTPDYLEVACKLLPEYGIPIEDAALLKEDESGYSSSFSNDPCPLRTYVFPRDISHLRNAYQETAGSGARDPYTNQAPSINFSIRDPNSGEDSIPVFSGVQTPLTQDAVIGAITQDFNRRSTKAVFIAAANILDTLFLMRAVRQESPNTRVLVENPHILMIPAAARDALTGAILLSTYPMFPEGEDWLDKYKYQHRPVKRKDELTFSDSTLQGLFNVSQLLLADLKAVEDPDLRAYRGFEDGGQAYPGIWALTLNRFGVLPLDLREKKWRQLDSCGPSEDCGWLKADNDLILPGFPPEIVPFRSRRITLFLVNAFILVGCFLLIRVNLSPYARKPLWLAVIVPEASRLQALLAACLSVTALDWFLISSGLWPLSAFFAPDYPIALIFHVVAIAGLVAPALTYGCLVALLAMHRRRGVVRAGWTDFRLWGVLYAAGAVAFFVAVVVEWYRWCEGPSRAAFFFRYRAMDVYSGSSPAAPLILLAFSFFGVSMAYFKRYSLAGPGRPRLEFTSDDDAPRAVAFHGKMLAVRESIERQILAPSTWGFWPSCARAALGGVFAGICLEILGRHLRAFELPHFNLVLIAGLLLTLSWLAIQCCDLMLLWRRVKEMLQLIDLLPLQPAIERMAREWPRRPIWAFRKSVSRQRLTRQMVYALHGRAIALRGTTAPPQGAERDLRKFLGAETGEREGRKGRVRDVACGKELPGAQFDLEAKEESEVASAEIALRILRYDLRPYWRESGTEDLARRVSDAQETPQQQYQRHCADFVALQYCRYVVYAVEQIQRLAICISVSFVLLLLFFNSYSPQGPQVVARFLAGLFVGVGYVITWVFAQMERNPLLSRMARGKPGELNREFWFQLVGLGGLPLLGVLAHLFPSVAEFLYQWLAPGVQALH